MKAYRVPTLVLLKIRAKIREIHRSFDFAQNDFKAERELRPPMNRPITLAFDRSVK
jgi:hypothetical protein